MRVSRSLAASLVAVGLVVGACDTSPAPPSVTSANAPVRGGTLVVATTGDASSLQPVITSDDPSASVQALIYDPVLATDPATGELRPGLAERFEQSSDGRRVTYTLRAGLVWSDGVPLTGEDYRYRIEAVARSKKALGKTTFADITGWADYAEGRADHIRGITVSGGGRVIEVDLDRSSCPALSQLAVEPLPRHMFVTDWNNTTTDTTRNIDTSSLNRAPTVASGPFIFKEWAPNDHITLVRNDRYWKGAPFLDAWVVKVVTNTRTALLTGEADIASVPAGQVADTRNAGTFLHDYRAAGLGYSFVGWNQGSTGAPWLADRRVRQALWYGLDVQAIIDGPQLGQATRVFAHTPPMSWAYDGTGLEHYDHDPGRARTLLEAAGARMGADGLYRWTDGSPMRVQIESDRATQLEIMQQQYRTIGIDVAIKSETFQALVGRVTSHDTNVQGFIAAFSLGAEPDMAYGLWHSGSGGNFAAFSDSRVDAALEAGRYGPDCSRTARRSAYASLDRILNTEAPVVFMYANANTFFVNQRVVAPPPLSYAARYDVEKWWLRP